MSEFALIDRIKATLGPAASAPHLVLPSGDDACVASVPAGCEVVGSIDTLVAGRHFPEAAAPEDIGYRAIMVAASDLAAMGADPHYALVAVTAPEVSEGWWVALSEGMANAATACAMPIAGGNLSQGPLSISISVQGTVPAGQAVTRAGARPRDTIYVTGDLGGAAAALEDGFSNAALRAHYYRPKARLDLSERIRLCASAAIDVSDGLLQDLSHIALASDVAVALRSGAIPLASGATLQHALRGGDDYEVCFAAAQAPDFPAVAIGEIRAGVGVLLDDEPVEVSGYQHFESN